MTPEEFKLKMQTLVTKCGDDPETLHVEMDKLMCELLTNLGYGDGVEVFNHQELWYS